jgi:hypothetical protein
MPFRSPPKRARTPSSRAFRANFSRCNGTVTHSTSRGPQLHWPGRPRFATKPSAGVRAPTEQFHLEVKLDMAAEWARVPAYAEALTRTAGPAALSQLLGDLARAGDQGTVPWSSPFRSMDEALAHTATRCTARRKINGTESLVHGWDLARVEGSMSPCGFRQMLDRFTARRPWSSQRIDADRSASQMTPSDPFTPINSSKAEASSS